MSRSSPPAHPEPNRIHHLPVRVSYYIPSSKQYYSTTFPALQQVYIHPNAGAPHQETWGSIYLKTVVKGVLSASPELHPAYPGAPDLSLYVLDPRETFFRRSRGESSQRSQDDVWTGKGLVSWTLSEAGQGKNLIAGRLVRNAVFNNAIKAQGLSALEGLMEADHMGEADEQSWGIELYVGLNMGLGSHGPPRSHVSVSTASRRCSAVEQVERSDSARGASPSRSTFKQGPESPRQHPSVARPRPVPVQDTFPTYPPSTSVYSTSPIDAPTPNSSMKAETVLRAPRGRPPKPVPKSSASGSRELSNASAPRNFLLSDGAGPSSAFTSDVPSSDPAPMSDASSLLPRVDNLTREQAQRLLASPAFLDMLGKITGLPEPGRNVGKPGSRKRAGDEGIEPLPKRKRGRPSKAEKAAREVQERAHETLQELAKLVLPEDQKGSTPEQAHRESSNSGLKCWNCGRTKSAVWRTKLMENGQNVRVCNACGLYWNQAGSMRPPNLWADGDDDRSQRATSTFSEAPSEGSVRAHRAHRLDVHSHVHRAQESFKRTLSAVVEQDAKRLGFRHKTRGAHSPHNKPSMLGHKSSPPRGSASASQPLRSGKHIAASSPGRFLETSFDLEADESSPDSDTQYPVTRPAPPQRRLTKGPPSDTNIQTLDLPLSDDGSTNHRTRGQTDWNEGGVSGFFNVEGFSMADDSARDPPPVDRYNNHRSNPPFATSSSAVENAHFGTDSTMEEDNVLSQLFNRTSSVNASGSSPAFDFSQLPPSSPPMSVLSSDALPHSALLLSSPMKKTSPSLSGQTPSTSGLTPLDGNRLPQSASKLRQSFQFEGNGDDPHDRQHQQQQHAQVQNPEHAFDLEGFQRMFDLMPESGDLSHHTTPSAPDGTGFEDPHLGALNELIGKLGAATADAKAEAHNGVNGGPEGVEGETSSASAVLGEGGEDLFASFMEGGAFI